MTKTGKTESEVGEEEKLSYKKKKREEKKFRAFK